MKRLDRGGDIVTAFDARFGEWEDPEVGARAATRARGESTRLGNGFARAAWMAAGIGALMWMATGDKTCPYCQEMDGRIVSIERDFLGEGDSVGDMSPGGSIAHPPTSFGLRLCTRSWELTNGKARDEVPAGTQVGAGM